MSADLYRSEKFRLGMLLGDTRYRSTTIQVIAFIVFVVSRHGNLSPETTNSFLVPLMLNSVFLCPFCLTTLI